MYKFTMKTGAALCGLLLLTCTSGSVMAEDVLPKPGTTIDKSNYLEYKHLFPEELLPAFTTGWDLLEPLSITVKAPIVNLPPQKYLDVSQKNKGKYDVDADGYITGGPTEDIVGFPFPDLSPDDKDFVTKFMWNQDYKYDLDDARGKLLNFQKRVGAKVNIAKVEQYNISFQNRMYDDPTPTMETKNGLRAVTFLKTTYPPVQKNFITMLIRYKDQRKPDTTFLYLPTMRRVLRGEAGQRSTPINSSTQAPDDFQLFQGKKTEFTYKLIGEQKMVVLGDAKLGYEEMDGKKFDMLPIEKENWMVKDVYVVDIVSKDPTYPQGRKRVWIDKENYWCYYGAAWDRAGALWKVWIEGLQKAPLTGSEDTVPFFRSMMGMDIQLGYATNMFGSTKYNGNGLTESDASVGALRKNAR